MKTKLKRIIELAERNGLELEAMMCTHAADDMGAIAELAAEILEGI